MVPSQRALQRLRNEATSYYISKATFREFCDRAGNAVIWNIIFSCNDPDDNAVGAATYGTHARLFISPTCVYWGEGLCSAIAYNYLDYRRIRH